MTSAHAFDRRQVLQGAATLGLSGALLSSGVSAQTGGGKPAPVVVGVMGLQRGRALALGLAALPGVEVRICCDTDSKRAARAAKDLVAKGAPAPQVTQDFRRILDDPEIDALICAAPNHWHAPATILACQAGKHVYVEKPCAHNPWEAEAMARVARETGRIVQVGTQRRSAPAYKDAIKALHGGAIGRVYESRSWYMNKRGSIGHGKPADVPAELDFDLWQGPAPRRPYVDNLVHYNWHWRWQHGCGELGNNGVHTLDLARWGLGVDFPIQVNSTGGRYHFDDDQVTPDTHTVGYVFEGERSITWQGHSCNRLGSGFVTFYGDGGSLSLDSSGGWRVYDLDGKVIRDVPSTNRGDKAHLEDFVRAVRGDTPDPVNAEIGDAYKSTLLSHLGNIAHRVGRSLHCDPTNGHILNDEAAMALWKRDYEPGWEPKV